MFLNNLNNLASVATKAASNVTSTVKELANEVMDNEREYKREREENGLGVAAASAGASSTSLPPPPPTLGATPLAPQPLPPPPPVITKASDPVVRAPKPPAPQPQQQQGGDQTKLESLKKRIEKDRSRANRQHELLERIRAAKAVKPKREEPPPRPNHAPATATASAAEPEPPRQPPPTAAAPAPPPSLPPPPPPMQGQEELVARLERSLREVTSKLELRERAWRDLSARRDEEVAALRSEAGGLSLANDGLRAELAAERAALADARGRRELEEEEKEEDRERKVRELEERCGALGREKERLQRHLLEIEQDQDDRAAHYETELLAMQSREKETNAALEESMALRAELDSKGYEVLNLQAALAQLTADSELCAKLRLENRALERAEANATEGARAAGEEAKKAGEAARAAEAERDGALRDRERMFRENISLKQENVRLGSALAEAAERIKAGGAGGRDDQDNQMVDRRIVYKLLTTYLQRRRWEVMETMGGILGFTDEEKRRVHELATKGIIGTVAGVATAPLSMAGSAIGQAKVDGTDSSLGELWIQFLSDEGSPAEG
ncbi:GRIP domain-containing protein [Chloropicon roscoffensis]|uniref:GRIP domain-containing protein n=1 Tax=Chloropicon roscoffensis TaxID=1461544 RepID=A0AAX4P873_9CHLO|mmetsp:Transcript_3700/g.11146  ORF Transcript_3700/g.11146 Transcript_3700/m.11146 type:complete len:559 (-) Transcript_3700:98-1774(-)